MSPPIEIPATPLSLILLSTLIPHGRNAYFASRDDGINAWRYDVSVYLLIMLQLRYCIPWNMIEL